VGIKAPKDVGVHREEIYLRLHDDNDATTPAEPTH
jgi:sRNA-binding carbon storage regulator CsrA